MIVSGDVAVGVRLALSGPGIAFILRNYLAGGNVQGESIVVAPPIVVSVPIKYEVEKATKNSLICFRLVQSFAQWLNNYLNIKL